jgi:hypothetical protein
VTTNDRLAGDLRAELLKEFPPMDKVCLFFRDLRHHGLLRNATIAAVKQLRQDNKIELTRGEHGFFQKPALTAERVNVLLQETFSDMIFLLEGYAGAEQGQEYDYEATAIAGCIIRLGQLYVSVIQMRSGLLAQPVFNFIKSCNEHRDLGSHNNIHDKEMKFNPLNMMEIMNLAKQGKEIWEQYTGHIALIK